jgi:hypothetical protein
MENRLAPDSPGIWVSFRSPDARVPPEIVSPEISRTTASRGPIPMRRADLHTNYSNLQMKIFTRNSLQATDRREFSWPDTAANRERKRPARSPRLARPTIGFWLGGGLLGTAGCILGFCMPYHHPVAVVISTFWWGIYLGCLGASVGALIGLFTEGAPAPPSRGVDGQSRPAAQATIPPAGKSLSGGSRIRKNSGQTCPKSCEFGYPPKRP